MVDYEVLILDEKGSPRAYVEMQDGDDDGAIRSALHIANGRPFEVWRDIVCIYRSVVTLAPRGRPNSRWRGLRPMHLR
jgi:hypothetical protein